jgi:hypothetical protein
MLISATTLIVNVGALLVHIILRNTDRIVFPPAITGLIAATLALTSNFVDLYLRKQELSTGITRCARLRAAARHTVCLFSFISVVMLLAVMTIGSIKEDQDYDGFFEQNAAHKACLLIVSCLAVVSDAILGLSISRLTWHPIHRARSTMMISSVIQFIVGSLLLTANWQPYKDRCARLSHAAAFSFYQQVGAIISGAALLGFVMSVAVQETNGRHELFTRFIHLYNLLTTLAVILCTALVSLSLALLFDPSLNSITDQGVLMSNPILASTALILLIINLVTARYMQEPPPSNLAVEQIDLASLTPPQRAAYATLISRFGKSVPGSPSGEAAVSLMLSYSSSPLPTMTCVVLRIFKPSKEKSQKFLSNALRNNSAVDEYDRAWRNLDEEKMVLRLTNDPPPPKSGPSCTSPPKLSRYAQKKLARKQAATEAKDKTVVIDPPERKPSLADITFSANLEATEALVLLTRIDDYDLTSSVGGWAGILLQYTLGSKSYFKPLCVRLGLLASHWPFRQSIFYCSYSRRPVARSAAVLRAIAEWNKGQRLSERCSVLMGPIYRHEDADRAIAPSGWQRTPLPSSHIVDLRPHKSKTLSEYLKSITYRDQEGNFKKANGEVKESKEFTVDECGQVMRLWHQTAAKRTSDGDTPVLATPNEYFLKQLGECSNGNVTLMFLNVGDRTVASCVLFRLGDTITSDLQGLDYELARPLKAYFVMMQHVIAIALREGYSFVDFGPTTAKPKMDIGCHSVPLVGAMNALSPAVSVAISIKAANIRKRGDKDS